MFNKFILQSVPRIISTVEYSSGIKKNGGFVYSMPPERQTDKNTGSLELICCLDGEISCDMYDVTVSRGQMLCLPSDVSVRLKAVKTPWRYISVVINVDASITRIGREELLAAGAAVSGNNSRYPQVIFPIMISDVSTVEIVNFCVAKIMSVSSRDTNAGILADTEMVLRIFAAITDFTESEAERLNSAHDGVQGYYSVAVEYINEHINEKISVSDIADAAEISYGHLTRVIKRTSGLSPVELINKMKLDEVRKILEKTDVSLSTAGKIVGIDDGKYLSRLFKKYIGTTYSDFKKNS